MRTSDLKLKLEESGIRADSYSIGGFVKNEALILEPSTGNEWRIYYSERGLRTGERVFPTEDEACQCLYEMLLRDPTVKRRT